MSRLRTPSGRRPAVAAMTVEEARAIERNAAGGLLDLRDPAVARVVQDAHSLVVRAQLFGDEPVSAQRRSRRLLLTGTVVVIAVWVAGFLLPVLR